jgi:hypothetical protein
LETEELSEEVQNFEVETGAAEEKNHIQIRTTKLDDLGERCFQQNSKQEFEAELKMNWKMRQVLTSTVMVATEHAVRF